MVCVDVVVDVVLVCVDVVMDVVLCVIWCGHCGVSFFAAATPTHFPIVCGKWLGREQVGGREFRRVSLLSDSRPPPLRSMTPRR